MLLHVGEIEFRQRIGLFLCGGARKEVKDLWKYFSEFNGETTISSPGGRMRLDASGDHKFTISRRSRQHEGLVCLQLKARVPMTSEAGASRAA
jgi:hypothetical protein